jgi:hypothetical protein
VTGEIVPFGKYRGQPVEMLAADTDYCEWLIAQPWFKARYLNVYNTVINYGAEPQDSPEHNQMQARFLDDDWCLALADRLKPKRPDRPGEVLNRAFEQGGWDVAFDVYGPAGRLVPDKDSPYSWRQRWERCPHDADCRECELPRWPTVSVHVECKPDLGDDYPAVLRQVQRYMSSEHFTGTACVLVRRHAFEAVTWDQVQKIFAASDIKLIAESDIGSAGAA